MPLVSIVIPVYFNESSLELLAQRLNHLADCAPQHNFEFIYVDDGSGDNSFEVLKTIADKDPRVQLVKLVRNFGSNVAILAGLSYARGDCVGFIAADLQDPPEILSEMIQCWESGKPVIFAVRKNRHGDPFFTRITANVFNWLFERLVFHGVSTNGIGFFLIDRKVVDLVIRVQERNSHLIGLILWTGFPYTAIEYERVERAHGKSRWTLQRKINYFIDTFAAFSYLPLRLASFLGFVFSGMGGLYAILLIFLRLISVTQTIQGWTALIVVVLVVSGVQMIILGIIGEYLWRNFDATRKRPLFIVDTVLQSQRKDFS